MTCSFCGGAAHPSTGCVYGSRTIACHSCTVEFWRWVRSVLMGKGLRRGCSFYEAAGRWRHATEAERQRQLESNLDFFCDTIDV